MAASFELDDAAGFGKGAGAFAQDGQQHSVDGTSAVVVAQAQTANVDPQGADQLENSAAGNPPAGPVAVYTVDANTNTVKLPANVSIDDIRIEGNDLVLQQADGSEIIIKNGALNVPNLIIGDVEIPRVALLAALEADGMVVAFGADGTISAKEGNPSAESSGGNFDVPPGGIGPGLDLIGLLPPTELTFPELERRELFPTRLREEEAEPAPPRTPRTCAARTPDPGH